MSLGGPWSQGCDSMPDVTYDRKIHEGNRAGFFTRAAAFAGLGPCPGLARFGGMRIHSIFSLLNSCLDRKSISINIWHN